MFKTTEPNFCSICTRVKTTGDGGGVKELVINTVAPTELMMTGGASELRAAIVASPTVCTPCALISGSMVKVFSEPSGPALPTILLPRIPMVATGVVTVIPSTLVLAIWPLTKENTPSTILARKTPVSVPGS